MLTCATALRLSCADMRNKIEVHRHIQKKCSETPTEQGFCGYFGAIFLYTPISTLIWIMILLFVGFFRLKITLMPKIRWFVAVLLLSCVGKDSLPAR